MKNIAILLVVVILSACNNSAQSVSDSANGESNVSKRVVSYETRIGTFRVSLPDNYVSVRHSDVNLFNGFQKPLHKLKLVDVFITKSDFSRYLRGEIPMLDQYVEIQLYPSNFPTVDDDGWDELRVMFPKFFKSPTGRVYLKKGISQVKNSNLGSGSSRIFSDLQIGDIAVYSNTEESVRWVGLARLSIVGVPEPISAVLATAARRAGSNVYLVASVQPVESSEDALEAISSFNHWLGLISVDSDNN